MTTPSPTPPDSTDDEAIRQRLAQVQDELYATQVRLARLEQRFGWLHLSFTDLMVSGMALLLSVLLGGIGSVWLMRPIGAVNPAVIFTPLVVGLILPIWFVPPLVRYARTHAPRRQCMLALALLISTSLVGLWWVAFIFW